jgi:hypothetical protein
MHVTCCFACFTDLDVQAYLTIDMHIQMHKRHVQLRARPGIANIFTNLQIHALPQEELKQNTD